MMATTTDKKAESLDWVTRQQHNRWTADQHFKNAVVLAKQNGASIREIAEAAGYESHSSVQKILDKHT